MNLNKEELEEIIKSMDYKKGIDVKDIPSLDLYMDQVITLFENHLNSTRRNDEDKILTKTMINNYAKDKLMMPIKNKKYTREHIIILIIIYNLKQSLSIADIKRLLEPVVAKINNGDKVDIIELYTKYLNNYSKELDMFNNNIVKIFEGLEAENSVEFLILYLINNANMYKRLGEKLIDLYYPKDSK
ncbi:DUF1836 domain-containing protein [Clostridium hydrogeniformans]|uniref:DUF1836 domain-containing protein n=1 Tax=Clostridium hydrogeniformans TaxID=349933 RepID=UPI00048636B8|nr:DUF1836 domain-containing protein [Clostridium hydrogeniformans]